MTKEQLKKIVCQKIDENREKIYEIGEKILEKPEMGFKELNTSNLVKEIFDGLGLAYEDKLALTGVKARVKGKNSKSTVCVIGEMDAVICPSHPKADSNTGASHSCGHNAQMASMLGAAFGLVLSDAVKKLDGDVVFMAVPGEEFVELEYREKLKRDGKIEFFGGKQELIRIGAFNDIDMAMMVHAQANETTPKVLIHGGSTGFIGKTVKFKGKEAHAGGAPNEGINALNAAMAALMCIHAQRETFKDSDQIRVHPIITKGGDLVNIVPADVRMETYVRGKTIEAVIDANNKVNRAIKGGAYAIGAEVEITELPGYLPLEQSYEIGELFADNYKELVSSDSVIKGVDMIGSTDIGDLGSIIPIIQPTMGGFKGSAHSKDFEITDKDAAYIIPAKTMAMTVIDLLWDGAVNAQKVKENFKPKFTPETYIEMWERLTKDE